MTFLPRRTVALLFFTLIVLVSLPAFAQTGGTQPPPLTEGVATALALSLIIGAITDFVQSGSIFGITTTPQAWLPGLTVAITFLTGVAGFVTSLGGGFIYNLTDITYAIAAGIGSLIAGATPSLVRHAHSTLPAARFAVRLAKRAAIKTASAALLLLSACQAVIAPVSTLTVCVIEVVAVDSASSMSFLAIVGDCFTRCGGDIPAILAALENCLNTDAGYVSFTQSDIDALRAEYKANPEAVKVKVMAARKAVSK